MPIYTIVSEGAKGRSRGLGQRIVSRETEAFWPATSPPAGQFALRANRHEAFALRQGGAEHEATRFDTCNGIDPA